MSIPRLGLGWTAAQQRTPNGDTITDKQLDLILVCNYNYKMKKVNEGLPHFRLVHCADVTNLQNKVFFV